MNLYVLSLLHLLLSREPICNMNCQSKLSSFLGINLQSKASIFTPPVSLTNTTLGNSSKLSNFFGTGIISVESSEPQDEPTYVDQNLKEKTEKIEEIVQNKIYHGVNRRARSNRHKTWRNKASEESLKARYLNESYVSKLLLNHKHEDYDQGKRPTCPKNCQHNCKAHFMGCPDLLQNEMKKWWGPDVTSTTRTAILCEDLRLGFTMNDDGTAEQRYFILGKRVCRSFLCELVVCTTRSCSSMKKI